MPRCASLLIAASMLAATGIGLAHGQDLDNLLRKDLPAAPPGAALEDDGKDEGPAEMPAAPDDLREVTPQDCQRLSGSQRFVRKIGTSKNRMPIRFLAAVVINRPLAEFTPNDFADLERIGLTCAVFRPGELQILVNFEEKVTEAQEARRDSLDWVRQTLSEVEELKPGRDAIIYLNTAWNEMLRREPTLMTTDVQVVSAAIILKQEQVYQRLATPQGGRETDDEGDGLPIGGRDLPRETGAQ